MEPVRLEERRIDTPAFTRPEPTKWCVRCKKTKLLTADYWYRQHNQADGFMSHCKACHRKPSPNPIGWKPGRATVKSMGSHGVTIRAGYGVQSPAYQGAAPTASNTVTMRAASSALVTPAAPAQAVEERPVESRKEAQDVELVDASRSFMGKTTLGEYMALEEAPSVWVGPAGVSVMATPGAGGVEYAVVTPFGDAPPFRTDRETAHYIAALLVDKHAATPGAPLEGVILVGGSRKG